MRPLVVFVPWSNRERQGRRPRVPSTYYKVVETLVERCLETTDLGDLLARRGRENQLGG